MIFHDVDQNTDEWLDLRTGKLTGSNISKVMASPNNYKVLLIEKDVCQVANTRTKKLLKKRYSGELLAHNAMVGMKKKDTTKAFGEPAKKLAVSIAIEQLTGKRSTNDSYSNAQMQRGHDQEPIARMLYENEYFVDVRNGGFFDCGDCGCSPDGLVGVGGRVEIKSVLSDVHYANIKRGSLDPAYSWQHYFNLLKTEGEWIDFVSYCADFPEESRLYVHRVEREECQEKFDMINQRSEQFFELVNEIKTRLS